MKMDPWINVSPKRKFYMGKVMSEINANCAGQVNHGEVSKLVKAILLK